MYPDGPSSTIVSAGPIGDRYEGASRPGHFDGVLTVVAKLFGIAQPDVALFGQKDAQQVFLVSRMVADLDLPLRIEAVPTVREPDGLALSSRNRYLDETQRKAALVLAESLRAADAAAGEGVSELLAEGVAAFGDHDGVNLDYFVVVDPATFLPIADGFRGRAPRARRRRRRLDPAHRQRVRRGRPGGLSAAAARLAKRSGAASRLVHARFREPRVNDGRNPDGCRSRADRRGDQR